MRPGSAGLGECQAVAFAESRQPGAEPGAVAKTDPVVLGSLLLVPIFLDARKTAIDGRFTHAREGCLARGNGRVSQALRPNSAGRACESSAASENRKRCPRTQSLGSWDSPINPVPNTLMRGAIKSSEGFTRNGGTKNSCPFFSAEPSGAFSASRAGVS